MCSNSADFPFRLLAFNVRVLIVVLFGGKITDPDDVEQGLLCPVGRKDEMELGNKKSMVSVALVLPGVSEGEFSGSKEL